MDRSTFLPFCQLSDHLFLQNKTVLENLKPLKSVCSTAVVLSIHSADQRRAKSTGEDGRGHEFPRAVEQRRTAAKKTESTKSRFTKGDAEGRRGGGGKNNDEDNEQGDDERSRCR